MKKDISNNIFFGVLTKSDCIPRTLRPGYNPETGKYDEEAGAILDPEKVSQLEIAKNIVQNVPRVQNDETLGDYCAYFLRLLWIRENWLLSRNNVRRSWGPKRKETTVKGYVDLHENDALPLLGTALHCFCQISIRPSFLDQVISLAACCKAKKNQVGFPNFFSSTG